MCRVRSKVVKKKKEEKEGGDKIEKKIKRAHKTRRNQEKINLIL